VGRNVSILLVVASVILVATVLWMYRPDIRQVDTSELTTVSNDIIETKTEDAMQKTIFGYSESGREISGYEIGTGENALLLLAGMHGREKGGKDLLDRLAEEVLANSDLINTANKLIIIPLVNPDGYYGEHEKVNANEVNLNRNFDTSGWVRYEGEGTFAGPKPFSESESRVIKELVEKFQPRMMIAFHSQGHLVSPEAGDSSINLAKWYSNKTGYHYFDEWDYAGTATRWFQEITGNPAITVELPDHNESDWESNIEALLELSLRDIG